MADPRGDKIDFEHTGIGAALAHNRLIVPLNQREYSWATGARSEALLEDFNNSISGGKSTYFLGTVVLTRVRRRFFGGCRWTATSSDDCHLPGGGSRLSLEQLRSETGEFSRTRVPSTNRFGDRADHSQAQTERRPDSEFFTKAILASSGISRQKLCDSRRTRIGD